MSSVAATPPPAGGGVRAAIQRFGGNLAAMVMPNIGAFIAWGLITALFIPTGWIPNEDLATLVGPMILTLLPLLIGYTGGRLVHGQRGAVAGAVATMGIIVGVDIPMFLGAMIIGPLAALVLKWFDGLVMHRVRSGFEMLVGNFSLGILAGGMALLGYLGIGPVVEAITNALGDGVEVLVDNRLLPIASIVIEPAKVLFMNNAINHGVLGPIGVTEAKEAGAAIIHFLGGIHEIYFPYVLMKPQMILAAIAGGAAGVMTFLVTGAGLVATPSPGSIF